LTRRVATLALAAIVLAACGRVATSPPPAPPRAVATAPQAPAASARAAPPLPVRLRIPSIGVDAELESVGVDERGNLAAPSDPRKAAWYREGPAPGEPGDAVIDGHLDWTTGPAVFWDLERVQAGDEIDVVFQAGVSARFAVADSARYPYDSHPSGLFSTDGPARLSLITCAGSWDRGRRTYLERLIVHASYLGA
jgi:sortase (surface protein transpeptidase)